MNSTEYSSKYWFSNKEKLSEYHKNYRENNRDKMRLNDKKKFLKKKYGITIEQFDQMRVEQNGKCAICSNQFKDSKDTCVDHCHTNGKVRQLLCFSCNVMLGHARDSQDILKSALTYLEKHKI